VEGEKSPEGFSRKGAMKDLGFGRHIGGDEEIAKFAPLWSILHH